MPSSPTPGKPDREPIVIIFSKALARKKDRKQRRAVLKLRTYASAHPGVWEHKEGKKMDETFAPFFNGKFKLYEVFATAHGILFQPEVIRGDLTRQEQAEVTKMGFDVCTFD
jgi:hypothetical protein